MKAPRGVRSTSDPAATVAFTDVATVDLVDLVVTRAAEVIVRA